MHIYYSIKVEKVVESICSHQRYLARLYHCRHEKQINIPNSLRNTKRFQTDTIGILTNESDRKPLPMSADGVVSANLPLDSVTNSFADEVHKHAIGFG